MMLSPPNFEDGYSYNAIDEVNGILAFIVFIVLTPAWFSTLSYINGVPMAKKCLLLYLYKDTFHIAYRCTRPIDFQI